MLLCGPAATLAKSPRRACVSATERSAASVRACAAHHGSTHKHRKGKPRHRKHRSTKKSTHARQGSSTGALPAQEPASCEDGTNPTRAADGSYECADGAEPECTNGSEPIFAPHRAQLLCPAANSGVEWTQASCDDGGTPTSAGGAYSCEDGSSPECEDGSTPVVPDVDAQPACIESAASVSSGSPSSGTDEEEVEAEDVDDVAGSSSARVATAS
jgi:hypothetical protein